MKHNVQGILQSNQTVVSLIQRVFDMFFIIISLYFVMNYFKLDWSLQQSAMAAIAVTLFNFSSGFGDLYISWRGLSPFKEMKKVTVHLFISAGIIFICATFLTPQYPIDTPLMLMWFVTTLLLLITYRIVLRLLLSTLRSNGFNTRSFVIAGAGQLGQKLVSKVTSNQALGLVFKGYYDDSNRVGKSDAVSIDGDLEQLVKDCKNGLTDRVYITLPMRAEKRIKWLMKELADSTASVYLVPDVFMFELLHARSDVVAGIPTISIYDSPLDGSNKIIKRVEDVVLSSIILLLITPVLICISIAVKLSSPGPILFKQNRYGVDGTAIKVWKFRSMTVMEDGKKVTQAKKNDIRLTSIGRFIRSTSLDELPQFFNVLQGRMSIVGPRPHAVTHNEEYRTIINGYMLRHKVKPGITGWAQVNGWRGETDTLEKMEKRVEFDLDYIQNWSLIFDIKIIVATIFKGFIDKNAY
ncbi:undecaprenyl-phosphate glucose phosphotransferase [Colwellia sp. MB3u-55]|uniref:undecaprenyl-phosphate glucose phosphotransferase n=1 Tax=Colwellia sp. MB3u-55 TaxID=2759810 RepID=UPI0015F726B0|nr:undecaprenyl-phosphate glucose phosphotransferase [Colwellia sp. MB3u-55]MBA6253758.1 undecaprenyl-phosphate glucose phosphotransferase [Colwellia sp. MB3u-55]